MNRKTLLVFLNAFSGGVSGGDLSFIQFAKRLNDYSITVVTSLLGMQLCVREGLKADYILTSRERAFRNVLATYGIRTILACVKTIFSRQPRNVYATSDFLPDVAPAFLAKTSHGKVKWVQKIFHLIPPERKISYYAQRISFFLIKKRADLIIVDNELLKEKLLAGGFPSDRLKVLTPGIDWELLKSPLRKRQSRYDGVFLGRIHPSKGVFELIDIWRLVADKLPDARLAIIGHGQDWILRELKQKIKSSGIERNVELAGYLERRQAVEKLKSGKIFVFPSHEEGFGMAIAEALACGLAVVAFDLPSYRVNFPGVIRTAPKGDVKMLASAILNLLANRKEYLERREQGRVFSKRFDWSVIARREIDLIEAMLRS